MKFLFLKPFIRIYISLLGFVFILMVGTVGYILIENYSFLNALYMTVITLATVGYMEVHPLSDVGKVFTMVLILANIGTFTYFITQVSTYFLDGEFIKTFKTLKMQDAIQHLEGHVIICGFGRTGNEAARSFQNTSVPVVVIDNQEERIADADFDVKYFLTDDATRDEALVDAGIHKAAGLIAALPEDADNLFVVLTARELNKKIKIISRASIDTSIRKLKIAGANNVIMPDKIGGAHMASLVLNPDIKEFIDEMSTSSNSKFKIVELESFKTVSLYDLNAWVTTGATILGLKTPDGEFAMNPVPKTILYNGSKVIVMGSDEQINKLDDILKN